MKKTSFFIATMWVVSIGSAYSADGVSGSIDFTGTVAAAACTISDVAGSGSDSGTIDFGTISSSELTDHAARTPSIPFSIELSNCPTSSSAPPKITFNGEEVGFGLKTLASGVPDVGIYIVDADNISNPYPLGVPTENTGLTNGWNNNLNVITGNFSASLVSMANGVKSGNINSTATFIIDYSDI